MIYPGFPIPGVGLWVRASQQDLILALRLVYLLLSTPFGAPQVTTSSVHK